MDHHEPLTPETLARRDRAAEALRQHGLTIADSIEEARFFDHRDNADQFLGMILQKALLPHNYNRASIGEYEGRFVVHIDHLGWIA